MKPHHENIPRVNHSAFDLIPAEFWILAVFIYTWLLIYIGQRPGHEIPAVVGAVRGFDKFAHAIGYGILAFFLFRAVYPPQPQRPPRIIGGPLSIILYVSMIGALDEIFQLFHPTRHGDILDWVADTAGAIIVVSICLLHRKRRCQSLTG